MEESSEKESPPLAESRSWSAKEGTLCPPSDGSEEEEEEGDEEPPEPGPPLPPRARRGYSEDSLLLERQADRRGLGEPPELRNNALRVPAEAR